jgi:ABC-type Co2+ transport system permease subunit
METTFFWSIAILVVISVHFVGNQLRRIKGDGLRRSVVIAVSLAPTIFWFGWAVSDGCIPSQPASAERCYGFGFGTVLFAPLFLAFAVSTLLGYRLGSFRRGRIGSEVKK